MHCAHKQTGFTLIEFIMVIVLIGIIGVAINKVFIQSLTTVQTGQNVADATWQGRLAIERMAREIRMVRSAGDISTNTSTQLTFTNISGSNISYSLSGTSLMRNSDILADGVSSLTFSYFDKNGASVGGTTNVHYITIALNVTQASSNYALTTSVYLRDLSS